MSRIEDIRKQRVNIINRLREKVLSCIESPPDSAEIFEDTLAKTCRVENVGVIRSKEEVFIHTEDAGSDEGNVSLPKLDPDYSLIESDLYPADRFCEILSYFLRDAYKLNLDVSDLHEDVERLQESIRSLKPTSRSEVVECVIHNKMEYLECTIDVTIPETLGEISRAKKTYTDESPPIIRGFVNRTENREVVYSDTEVTLITGSVTATKRRPEYYGLLLGKDDGGFFAHPIPDNDVLYDDPSTITRDKIRKVLGYDREWYGFDNIGRDVYNRIQGDLLIKYIDKEHVENGYLKSKMIDYIIRNELLNDFIKETRWNKVEDLLIESANLTRGTATPVRLLTSRRTIADEMNMAYDDVAKEMTSDLLNWFEEGYPDVVDEGRQEFSMTFKSPPSTMLPIDNHLILTDGFVDCFDDTEEPHIIPLNGGGFWYVFIPEETGLDIEHNEHRKLHYTVPSGLYIFALSRRR